MNILLTGGTGFLGSHFLRESLAAGHAVRAIKRSRCSQSLVRPNRRLVWLEHQLDQAKADELFGCDVLVHFAAHSVQYPYDNLQNCLRWNLIAALELFEQARLAGIRRYVVAGSCFEYGRSGERYDSIPTDAPLEPTNSYAASKAAASIALSQWAEQHQLDLEILRVFHVYGEGEAESRFWPSLRSAALSGADFPMTAGEQIRDFIPVGKVAQVFLQRAAEPSDSPRIRIYNVGTGKPRSLLSFARECWKDWDAQGRLVPGVVPYRENECMRYVPGGLLLGAS